MARGPQTYRIDGRAMTLAQIAGMVGVAQRTLETQKCRKGCATYQQLVDMYRRGEINRGHRGGIRHRIRGEWTTIQAEAARLGMKPQTMHKWMSDHRKRTGTMPLLEECVKHYEDVKAGLVGNWYTGGRPAQTYWVNGRKMTMKQAAALVGMQPDSLRELVKRRGLSVNAGVKYAQALQKKRAEREIMKTLGY